LGHAGLAISLEDDHIVKGPDMGSSAVGLNVEFDSILVGYIVDKVGVNRQEDGAGRSGRKGVKAEVTVVAGIVVLD